MKKLIVLLSILAIAIFSAPAYACEGPLCYGTGDFAAGVAAGDGSFDIDGQGIKRGGAGGLSYGVGGATAIGSGHIKNGVGSVDVTATGGGLTNTYTYKDKLDRPDGFTGTFKSVRIGSFSEAVGVAGATLDLSVNPGLKPANGYGCGFIIGSAAQGTLNGSYIILTNKFDSDGFTGGIAGQQSNGSFVGFAHVSSKGDTADYYYGGAQNDGGGWYVKRHGKKAGTIKWFNKHPENQSEWTLLGKRINPGVDRSDFDNLNASIEMQGYSYSESYRYGMIGDGWRTEGLGTNVGAGTDVITSGNVRGSFSASGGAATLTVQSGYNGGAIAGAVGTYSGGGVLGCDYSGSAIGYSNTSVTTFAGMNGSINSAAAGMTVSSQVSYDNPGNDPR